MSVGSVQAFQPIGTATIAGSTTIATATLPAGGDSVLVFNASAAVARVAFGAAATDAETAPTTPVPAGGSRMFGIGPLTGAAAVTLTSGTGNVYLTRGSGTEY